MGRLILVEGIPGSGKTTIAKKIAEYLSAKKATSFYEEGAGHPADLAWCACIPKDQLEKVIGQFPEYEKPMKEYGYEEEGYYIVPYTRFPIDNPAFWQRMESFEVYDNRVGFDTFVDLHLKKWIKFGKKAESVDEYTVFECAFLQNHINELLMFHNSSTKEITEYLLKLITTVKELNPVLIYLNQTDVRETIRRVSEVRTDDRGQKIWMERVIEYIENSPYGQLHELKGFDGMVRYFEDRKQIELELLSKLPARTYIIDNRDYQWDRIWTEVEAILNDLE